MFPRIFTCSGFKKIGTNLIIIDYYDNEVAFMSQDSLTMLYTKRYEEDAYLTATFDNPK